MRRLSLVHIETACCIARVGTFTAAAERLHTTQSTISARIREMEANLSIQLFARRGRVVELTPAGREFVRSAEPLLSQLTDLLLTFDGGVGAPVRVRIGGGPSTMNWLPAVLKHVLDAMPNLVYDLEVGMSAALIQGLEQGRLDLGVLAAGSIDHAKLHVQSLGHEPMLWFISAELWRGVTDLSPQALLDRFPVLLMPRPSFYFHRGLNALRGHGLAARRVNTCSNTAVTLSLIEGGTGIGLLPEGLARAHNSAGQLVQTLYEVPVEPIEYLIVRHHENNLPQLDAIIDMAVAASRSLLTPRAPTADRSSPP